MEYVIIAYLWLAILLYLILGGADFGAGIIELMTSPRNRKRFGTTAQHVIGPIWEANHMWLIIAIVILFVGFPVIYSQLSIHLHIPMVIMLIGIIARGTSFTFKHYDAIVDDTQHLYNRIFLSSTFFTPLFLGIIAASTISGKIDLEATDYLSAYVFSWLNWFSISVGLFTVALCGYLASIYLMGETSDEFYRSLIIRTAKRLSLVSIIFGALVFVAASVDHVPLLEWVFMNPVGIIAVVLASLSFSIQWKLIQLRKMGIVRLLAGFQITMILLAANYGHFPDFIIVKNSQHFSLFDYLAPEKTLDALGWALLIGSVFILPFLFYLFYSFEHRKR